MTAPITRLVAWNIRQGGGPVRTPEIGLYLLGLRPDVVVLQEFRVTRGAALRTLLADAGLGYHLAATRADGQGMLLASRSPVEPWAPCSGAGWSAGRWLGAWVPQVGVRLLGVHVPDDSRPGDKAAYLQRVIELTRARTDDNLLVVGDFNTARCGPDGDTRYRGEAMLGTLWSLGLRDLWREHHPGVREVTWEGPLGEVGRLDLALAAPAVAARTTLVRHEHGPRLQGLSDHSALLVELSGSVGGGAGPGRRGLF